MLPDYIITRVYTILSISLAMVLSGCLSSSYTTLPTYTQAAEEDTAYQSPSSDEAYDPAADSQFAALSREALLYEQAEFWNGTPHRLGGTTKAGIDCSALVQTIYSDLFHTSIPRTTAEQARIGSKIRTSELKPGDLVFYKIDGRTRHVGVYVEDGTFLHASKSEGVAISSLDSPYWRKRFWMARRILPPDTVAPDPENTALPRENVGVRW